MGRVAELVRELRSDGHPLDYVDAGGGLGIAYGDEVSPEFADQIAAYADALVKPLRGLKAHLLLEPGRAIVGAAGVLLTRVLYRKNNNGKKFVVVDAAMNDLLRPALYDAYHEIAPLRLDEPPSEQREKVDVVGPVCETGDFFAHGRELPPAHEGDLLAILDAGAYGMALASNYNTRPRPAEVLVDGKSVKLIRRRETAHDLFRLEA
jgi:diaminopimelate decarboxylase